MSDRDRPTKPWRDESALRELYVNRDMTQKEIANHFGCSISTVSNWIDEFDIETERHDPAKSGPWRNKDTLKKLFYEKGLSKQEIADKFDIDVRTVNYNLQKHDLQPESFASKFGYLESSGTGYVYFVDYHEDPEKKERVAIHRLLAAIDNDLSEFEDKEVHHKLPDPWANWRENVELLSPQDHRDRHF